MSVYLVEIVDTWLNENEFIMPFDFEHNNFRWNRQWLWCDICDIILFEVHTDKITIWVPDTFSPWVGQYFMAKDISAADPELFHIMQNEINTHNSRRCRNRKMQQ